MISSSSSFGSLEPRRPLQPLLNMHRTPEETTPSMTRLVRPIGSLTTMLPKPMYTTGISSFLASEKNLVREADGVQVGSLSERNQ